MYISSFLINGKVKPLFLNNPLSTLTWYQEPNLLGRIFFSLFFPEKPEELYNHFPQWLLVQSSLPPTIILPSKTPKILNIPFLQSISPISTNCHPLIISYGAFKSNLFLKVMIFITSLMALILHHHPSSLSLVLHPKIQHTQLGSIRIISFLAFSLVLSPFHYNRLLPAPPLPNGLLNTLPQRNSSCQHPSQNAQPVGHPSSPIDCLPLEPHNSETSYASTTAPPTHQNTHPMTTRAKNNIHKPLTKMNLIIVLSQPSKIEPHTVN